MGRGTSAESKENLLYGDSSLINQKLDSDALLKEKTLKLLDNGYPEQAKQLFLKTANTGSIESDIFNKQLLKRLLPLNENYAEKQLLGRVSNNDKFQSFLSDYLKQAIEEYPQLLNRHFTVKPGDFLYKLYSSPENARIMQDLIALFRGQFKSSESFFNSKLFCNHFNLWKKNNQEINDNRVLVVRAAAESLIVAEDQRFLKRLNSLQMKDYSQHIFKSHNRVIHKFDNRNQLRNIHRLLYQDSVGKLPDDLPEAVLDSNMVAVCRAEYNSKSPLLRNQYFSQNSLCRKCFSKKNQGYLMVADNQVSYSPEKNNSSFNEQQLKFCLRSIGDNPTIKEKIVDSDYRAFPKIILEDARTQQNIKSAQIETVYYRLQSSENIEQVVQQIFNNTHWQENCNRLTDYLKQLNPSLGLLPKNGNTRRIYNSFLLALAKITVTDQVAEKEQFLKLISQLIDQTKVSGEPLSAEVIFS
jgi:hypothetical protein